MKIIIEHSLLPYRIMRYAGLLFTVVFANFGFAQEQFARPVTLEADTIVRKITVLTFDNDQTKRWIVGTKNQPNGDVTDTSYYLLLPDAYLPTVEENSGNMMYDGEMIPLDGVVFGSIRVSNKANKRPFREIPELTARLELQRTVYKFKDTLLNSPQYEMFKDSVIKTEDHVFLRVDSKTQLDNDHPLHFAFIIEDTLLIKRKDFVVGEMVPLDEPLIKQIGIDKHENIITVGSYPFYVNNRIAIASRGSAYFFIKEFQIVVNEDRSTLPPIVSPKKIQLPWWICIVCGILLLAVLSLIVRLLVKGRKKTSQKQFTFSLGSILKPTQYNDAVTKLGDIADASMHFKKIPNKKEIRFVINEKNAEQFVLQQEGQEGFYWLLTQCINNAKPEESLSPEEKETSLKEIEAAKNILADIDSFVAQFMQQSSEDETREEDLNQQALEDDLKKKLEKYRKDAENWQELKQRMGKIAPKTVSDIMNKISELEKAEKEIISWKEQTKFNNPSLAARGITELKNSINTLQEKNNTLNIQKKDLEEIVKKVTKDPRSFKGKEGFDEISKLIKDAEKGTEVRDLMNSDPNEIKKDSATGILVRKGQIFDEYVTLPDEIFKGKDADSKIHETIANSPIALQIRKGDFLDKAKNNVKMIREDKEGWIGESELMTFIEYIVNPHEILKSERINTGLYKLMHDVDSLIAPIGKDHKSIKKESLQYNWLKERLENVIDGYNDYLQVELIASTHGTPSYDPSNLKSDIRKVFEDASRYLKFGEYKNYWKNIAGALYNTLDGLHNHDEIYNTRGLMFYTSQFYSIACIMNEIYGDESYSTTRPNINVSLFNTSVAPVQTQLGFPQLDTDALQKCKFEYKGALDEDQKVKYLKQYKPLPFIFIFSYFDDNILS